MELVGEEEQQEVVLEFELEIVACLKGGFGASGRCFSGL